MKSIILISHEYFPVRSGGVILLNEIINYLLKKEYKVKLITCNYSKVEKIKKKKNFEIVRINCLSNNDRGSNLTSLIIFFVKGLLSFIKLKKRGYNKVLSLFIVPSGLIGFLASILYGYKNYIFVGGADLHTIKSKFSFILFFLKPLTKLILKKANKVFVAEGLEYEYERIYGYKNYVIVKNGASTKLKYKKKKINKTYLDLLIVGRLVKRKGFYIILQAMTLLEKKYLDKIKLTIIGNGPEFENIKTYINNNDLQKNVKIIKGIDHKHLKKHYINSDIYLFPSFPEGNSLALIEAMSYNLPIVISKEKGNVELFDDNGWLIDIRNKKKVSERMKEILLEVICCSSDKLKEFGERSKKISMKYDWSEILPIYEKEISK